MFKYIIKIFLVIIEKAGPTIATIMTVFLAYKYAKKQKTFENRDDEYKKIRKVSANLLQIWRELSLIEFYISSEDIYAEAIFKNPQLASIYFNIDLKRIEDFKKIFHESKEELKSINVSLFYNLENNFQEFNKLFNYFISSEELKEEETEVKEFLENALKEVVRKLEDTVKDTAKYLPKIERKEIEKIIQIHHDSLKERDLDYEIPKFIIATINKFTRVIEPITSDEIKMFFNNNTVKMILKKFAPSLIPVFLKSNATKTVSNLFSFIENPEKMDSEINADDILLNLKLSDSDNKLLQNNLEFYKYICGIHKKVKTPIPMQFKRVLIQLNNGTIDFKKELEKKQFSIQLSRVNNS